MALSLLTVLVPLGFRVTEDVRSYRAAADTVSTVATVQDIQALIHELQKERGLTVGLLGGDTRFRKQLDGQRTSTDAAETTLGAQIEQGLYGGTAVRSALANLATLATLRGDVDRGAVHRDKVLSYYTDAIAALNTVDFGADSTADPALRRGLLALESLGDAKEFTGRERAILSGVFAAHRIEQPDYLMLMDDLGGKKAALAQFARNATPGEQTALAAAQDSVPARQAAGDEAIAVGSGVRALVAQVDPVAWFSAMTSYIDSLRQVQIGVGADIDARAASLRAAARSRLIAITVLTVIAVGFVIWLASRALRSVVRPLAQLSLDAQDLAVRRLPEAVELLRAADRDGTDPAPPAVALVDVPARSGAEIVALADALRLVKGSALALALGQATLRRNTADSMLNLARRNQNLVARQITALTAMERGETDADSLAKLFELDHLATRMRRNAESLLVLIGEAAPRRWAEPVPVNDLLRAAMSEVEEYPRVVLRQVDDVKVNGAALAELAHLLAELLENGLQFSPPDRDVEVSGQRLDSGYLISVTDHGVGMTAAALAGANAKLHGHEQFEVAPTRFLGHYVVGRLAERLGARVGLTASPAGGVIARLELPASLLAAADPAGSVRGGSVDPANSDAPVYRPQAGTRAPVPGSTRFAASDSTLPKRVRPTVGASHDASVVRLPGALHDAQVFPLPAGPTEAAVSDHDGPAPEQFAVLLSAFSKGHRQGALASSQHPAPTPQEER